MGRGKLPKGIMEVDAVRRRIGFRPYSSASWPIRGNPIILKIAPTCTHTNDVINKEINITEIIITVFPEVRQGTMSLPQT
jgi:hypothetical protein